MGWGESGFNCWGSRGLALILFYVKVSRMSPLSRLSSQSLTILSPRVILRVGWSIVRHFHPGACLPLP